VSARSLMKEKLICLNARFVVNGTISDVWASLEVSKMLNQWNSSA
jgi:hypothetical protein